MTESVPTAKSDGKLAENILYFARTLRIAGLSVGPASVIDCVRAVEVGGIGSRDDFYWTLHSILVKKREDTIVFDEAFRLFWRSRELVEKMLQMFSPQVRKDEMKEKARAGETRVSQALFSGEEQRNQLERPQIEIDASFTASQREVLRAKDFAQMTNEELALAKQAMSKMQLPIRDVATRRFKTVLKNALPDPRRMLTKSLRTGGDLIIPQFRDRKRLQPPVVILADISGSMSQYSRTFLHFFHALSKENQRVHTFLFGTRLTNITRQLRNKDVDVALQESADQVEDWSGGTRIGETLQEFNRIWARRVLGQGAVVLLVTDGLERDDHTLLENEMDRLHRSCRRLLWLNPLLRFEGFEPAARGIKAMLPHVDEFRAVHSLDALSGICEALAAKPIRGSSANGLAA